MSTESMRYPFAVSIVFGGFRTSKYARTPVEAEQAIVDALRRGADGVHVDYLRRPIAHFAPADLHQVVPGDPSTFLGQRLGAAIAALGPSPAPLPRGRRQRAVLEILQAAGLSAETSRSCLDALKEHLK